MKKVSGIIFVFCVALIFVAFGSYVAIRNAVDKPYDPDNSEKVVFIVESGEGVKKIAKNLQNNGLIRGSDFFEIYIWENGLESKLQAGEYEISPSMTIAEMVEIFMGGEGGFVKSNEFQISIPEGYSNREILKKLSDTGLNIEGDFDNLDLDFSEYDFIENTNENGFLQGYLFPDTYNFYKDSSLEKVTIKMLNNFDAKVDEDLRQEITRQGKNLREVLILASIVEKEAATKEEMSTVASVFYNRLAIGQALQSDATVNYVVGEGRAQATTEDIEIDSPFNTYKYAGLPPAPICNPGMDAIMAVVYPDDTDYFYFLTTQDEERKTYFSRTFEEHLQNKYKYLK